MSPDDTRPDIPALPDAATALRSYMRAAGWTEGTQGSAGSLFTKGGFRIGVPHEDDDPILTRGALNRLAVAEGRTVDETEAAVLAYRDGWPVAVSPVAATDDTARGLSGVPVQSQPRAGADAREALGRLVHQERLAAETERAEAEGRQRFLLEPWEERPEWQRELDIRIGHAVADYALEQNALTWNTSCTGCAALLDSSVREYERRERAEALLAEVRQAVASFLAHYGNTPSASFKVAGDLAHAMLQVIDRDKNGSEASGHFATCTGCGEQFADSESGEYLFARRERMEKLLDADGWQADPVLCPACQPGGAP